jgi:hypothetical protein
VPNWNLKELVLVSAELKLNIDNDETAKKICANWGICKILSLTE